ncbi:hypothetical protein [Rhizobium sp. PL01]|jgi:hypothetical protein|uniref:hypothetical protein n=1 Tax=Rhizobium sp. PL01 TaxID=3085631 RepID=UPI0029819EB4|nr:hypothetical protein [Rhizobium sp. PL01]MDW5316781.1 hypothetical protein [Rhizobium sp. PL01]
MRSALKILPICLAAIAPFTIPANSAMTDVGTGAQGQTIDGGISVRWTFSPARETGLGILDVFVSDKASGAPIRYDKGAVLGWMQRDRGGLVEPEKSCAEKIKTLATQGIGRRSDIDLNQYRIVSLNADGSMAFINPFVGFNNAKLESIVDLKSRPLDWLQVKDRMEMWVLLADPAKLVAVDLHSSTVTRTILLPDTGAARHMNFEPSTRRLWIGLPGAGQIASLALDDPEAQLEVSKAPGLADILSTPDGIAVAWLDDNNALRFLGHAAGKPDLLLPEAAEALVHSSNAKQTIVGVANGTLHFMPDGEGIQASELILPHRLKAMQLLDDGRLVLAIGEGRASVVDLATRHVVLQLTTQPGADRIVLTHQFAYAVGGPSGHATMYALEDLRRGRNQALDVMVSSPDPSDEDGTMSRVAAAPEGNGILVASQTDGMIYQYSEGMMAPVGSYSNYRRAAVGLDIVDYAFQEVGAGHYRATVKAGNGGRYELLIGAIGPRVSSCSDLIINGGHAQQTSPAARLHAQFLGAGERGTGEHPAATGIIRVGVTEILPGRAPVTLAGLTDLTLLVFDKHTGWQRRVLLRDMGGGQYETMVKLPRKSNYDLLVSSRSANLSFVEGQIGEKLLGPTQ